jgi:hypothetical protein
MTAETPPPPPLRRSHDLDEDEGSLPMVYVLTLLQKKGSMQGTLRHECAHSTNFLAHLLGVGGPLPLPTLEDMRYQYDALRADGASRENAVKIMDERHLAARAPLLRAEK